MNKQKHDRKRKLDMKKRKYQAKEMKRIAKNKKAEMLKLAGEKGIDLQI